MNNKEGVPVFVLGIVSVVITVAVFLVSKPNVTTGRVALVSVGSFVLILVASILSAWWALRIMPPSDYAQTMIGGRPTSEILQVISNQIRGTGNESLRHVASFKNQTANIPRRGDRTKDYSDALALLAKRFAKQHGSILRITAMLEIASEESNIPLRRLRDLLFNYDPGVHRAYAARYVHNAESLRELSEGDEVEKSNLEKRRNLTVENDYITRSAEITAESATRLINYAGLHPKILHLAAVHSTSQATKEHARGIAFVAKQTSEATKIHRDRWMEELQDGVAALRFLVRKQHAHSGFDLNQMCAQACIADSNKRDILQALSEDERTRGFTAFPLDLKDVGNALLTWKRISYLSDVDDVVKKRIDAERNVVVDGFAAEYDSWLESIRDPDPKFLLVTHGFSTTVREVFKRGIRNHAKTDIFIIGSGRNGALDSKLMRNCLMEIAEPEKFRNVTVGDEQSLLSFLDHAAHVMFVLGAECFDGKGRALHPRGLRMNGLRAKLAKNKVRVIVVAEGFKCYRDLLSIPWFYRYHLDRIQFYKPEWIDDFITSNTRQKERRTKPAGGIAFMHEKRNGPSDRRKEDSFAERKFIVRSRHYGLTQPNLPLEFFSQPIRLP